MKEYLFSVGLFSAAMAMQKDYLMVAEYSCHKMEGEWHVIVSKIRPYDNGITKPTVLHEDLAYHLKDTDLDQLEDTIKGELI
jgi:hypothetical protein